MSCSDKIAKWLHVGFQGSLLSAFVTGPLLPKAIIVGHAQANVQALQRAFFQRFQRPNHGIQISVVEYLNSQNDEQQGCDASIFWNCSGLYGVVVQGRKQGTVECFPSIHFVPKHEVFNTSLRKPAKT